LPNLGLHELPFDVLGDCEDSGEGDVGGTSEGDGIRSPLASQTPAENRMLSGFGQETRSPGSGAVQAALGVSRDLGRMRQCIDELGNRCSALEALAETWAVAVDSPSAAELAEGHARLMAELSPQLAQGSAPNAGNSPAQIAEEGKSLIELQRYVASIVGGDPSSDGPSDNVPAAGSRAVPSSREIPTAASRAVPLSRAEPAAASWPVPSSRDVAGAGGDGGAETEAGPNVAVNHRRDTGSPRPPLHWHAPKLSSPGCGDAQRGRGIGHYGGDAQHGRASSFGRSPQVLVRCDVVHDRGSQLHSPRPAASGAFVPSPTPRYFPPAAMLQPPVLTVPLSAPVIVLPPPWGR